MEGNQAPTIYVCCPSKLVLSESVDWNMSRWAEVVENNCQKLYWTDLGSKGKMNMCLRFLKFCTRTGPNRGMN